MRRLAIAALFISAACSSVPAPDTTSSAARKALLGDHGFDLAALDRTANPCDDFYQYATGNWRKSNPLPSTFPRFGRFEELAERNRGTLKEILEESSRSTDAPAGSATQKIGDFWAACMNQPAIESEGLNPIADDIARINAITDRWGVVEQIHRLQRRPLPSFGVEQRGGNPVFRFGAQNDFKDSNMIIAVLSQGGLGLPERDYYLRDDERFRDIRAKYVDHMTAMFKLAGSDEATARADAEHILALETELARASMSAVDQRNPDNVYHVTAVADLAATHPSFDWRGFFSSVGLPTLQSVNVAQPDFLNEAERLLEEMPVDTWKAYLRWNVLDAAAPGLPSAFVDQDFAFRGQVLSGQREIQPRWQRCVRIADATMGQLIGQEYVKRNFTPEAKLKMGELINNLIDALGEDIPKLSWMGTKTKTQALAKLGAFKRRIGYPDVWRDYAALNVSRDSYANNLFAAREFTLRRTVNRIGKNDDPNEWGAFTPATVNASYNPARNFITFPAGILQPPFYDPNADDAYNYGGIGMVIGHEMSHGFDDQGSKFDASGNLRDWWTPADLKNFQARAECIVN